MLNLVTKRPRDSQGGLVRLTGGELSTFNADLRWAGHLWGDWYGKATGGVRQSGDFTVSRNGYAEYSVPCGGAVTTDCLPQERVPLDPENDDEIALASARLDRYYGDNSLLSIEGAGRTSPARSSRPASAACSWSTSSAAGRAPTFRPRTGR